MSRADFQLWLINYKDAHRLARLGRFLATEEVFEEPKHVTWWTGEEWDDQRARPTVNAPRGCRRTCTTTDVVHHNLTLGGNEVETGI